MSIKKSNKYPTSERSHVIGFLYEKAFRLFDSAGVVFYSNYISIEM